MVQSVTSQGTAMKGNSKSSRQGTVLPAGAKILPIETAYHGEKSNDPLTKFFTWLIEKVDKVKVPRNTLDTLPFEQIFSRWTL